MSASARSAPSRLYGLGAPEDAEEAPQFGAPRRPGERARELDEVAATLVDWMSRLAPDSDPVAENLARPTGAGGSNETILLDFVHTENGVRRRRPVVLRIEPGDYRLFRSVDLRQQFDLLSALRTAGAVKVPEPIWFEGDASFFGRPFFIMERVQGQVPVSQPPYNAAGFLFEASPGERALLWSSAVTELGRISRTPVEDVQVLARSPEKADWEADFQFQLDCLAWAAGGERPPFLEETRAWLEANRPAVRPSGLSWGDARLGNMIFGSDFRLSAVLDWEQASLGGPLRDLGWWLFFDELYSDGVGLPRLDGMGTREDTISVWESVSGMKAMDLPWYEVFAGFQLGVLMLRRCNLQGRSAAGANGNNNLFTRQIAHRLGWPAPKDDH